MVNIIGRRVELTPLGNTAAPAAGGPAEAIAKMAATLFGPEALTAELKRRQAEQIDLKNEALRIEIGQARQKAIDLQSLAEKASDPAADLRAILGAGVRAGATAQLGDLLRTRASNFYGAGDDRATNAFVGAGGSYGSTVAGTREGEATKLKIADLTSRRQADGQIRAAGLSPVEALDATGNPTWTTRAAIADGTATGRGLTPVRSTDQTVAGEMQKALASRANGAAPDGPGADPFASLPNSVRKASGTYFEPKPFINPKTNTVAVSFDGGSWGVTDGGDWMPLRSGAWVPAGPENAVSESRLEMLKAHAARGNPNLTNRDPLTGTVAKSAYKATGADAFGQEHVNALLGSLGVTRLFGAGEIGPDYERARSNLEVFRQTAKNAFVNSPTFPIKEQKAIDEMLPGAAPLANPESQARKVGTIFSYLSADNDRLRRVIQTATDPTTANRANQALIENEKAIEMLTRGAGTEAPPASRGAPAGPAAAADGVTHVWSAEGGLRRAGR